MILMGHVAIANILRSTDSFVYLHDDMEGSEGTVARQLGFAVV